MREFREVWGIRTGDIARSSYGTGPYEIVRIRGPYTTSTAYVERGHPQYRGNAIGSRWTWQQYKHEPRISLICVNLGDEPTKEPGAWGARYSYLNGIRQEGGRFFAVDSQDVPASGVRLHDEIFIERRTGGPPQQTTLFEGGP